MWDIEHSHRLAPGQAEEIKGSIVPLSNEQQAPEAQKSEAPISERRETKITSGRRGQHEHNKEC